MSKIVVIIAVILFATGLALGIYLVNQQTRVPIEAVGDFEFGFINQIEVCETLRVDGWIKNISGRTANGVKLWLNPIDSGIIVEPEWPEKPGFGRIDTMSDGEVVEVILEFNPVGQGEVKNVRFWVDAAFSSSQSGTFDFILTCMVTPTPEPPTPIPPTVTPIPPTVTPILTNTPTPTLPIATPTSTICPLPEQIVGVEIVCL